MKDLLKREEYAFVSELNPCYVCLGGSHAYGTNVEGSDLDVRGVYVEKLNDVLTLNDKTKDVYTDSKTDTTLYGFKKFLNLVLGMNPNVIEMLGVREEDVLYENAVGRYMRENVSMFLSKRAFFTFSGYAMSQMTRLKNALNQEPTEVAHKKCGFYKEVVRDYGDVYFYDDKMDLNVKDMPVDLAFDMLNDMRSSMKNRSVGHRNNKKTENKLNKHAMHLLRLFYMGVDLLERGEVNTYRANERDLFLAVRNGDVPLDEVFRMSTDLEHRMKVAYHNSNLPDKADMDVVNEFYRKVMLGEFNEGY